MSPTSTAGPRSGINWWTPPPSVPLPRIVVVARGGRVRLGLPPGCRRGAAPWWPRRGEAPSDAERSDDGRRIAVSRSSRPARRPRPRGGGGQPPAGLGLVALVNASWTSRASGPGSRLIEASPRTHGRGPLYPEAYRPRCPRSSVRILRVSAKRLAAKGVAHQTIRRGGPGTWGMTCASSTRPSGEAAPASFPFFDRFAAGFAGGCAADEVVVHELGSDDRVVAATVTAFEVACRASLYQSARLTDRRWRDATTVLRRR